MDNVPSSAIMMIAGIIIGCLLVSMMAAFAFKNQSNANELNRQREQTISNLEKEKIRKYNGQKMTGAQVIALIQDLNEDMIPIEVEDSGTSSTMYNVPNGDQEADLAMELATAKKKIDSTSMFICSISTDNDGTPTKINMYKMTT